MPRELPAEVETIVNSSEFTYFDYAEIQLPLGPGEGVPQVITCSTAEVTFTPSFDFTAFIYAAFAGALNRSPTASEEADWLADLETGFATSTVALVAAAKDLVDDLFASVEYTDRMRTDDQFVEDLYRAFLARPSDASGKAYWLNRLLTDPLTRDELRGFFGGSDEFRDWAGLLNQTDTTSSHSRELGDLVFADSLGTDGVEFSLSNSDNAYSQIFGEPGRRLYPARATWHRAFKLADGTFVPVQMLAGFAKFNQADADLARISEFTDMNRKGVDIVEQVTQRCAHVYKSDGCGSPDPSPTCSRIKDDAVNGCASKLPALVNIDPSPTDNRARFKGIPQLSEPVSANPSVGLDPVEVDPGGWPGDIEPTDPRLRKSYVHPFYGEV